MIRVKKCETTGFEPGKSRPGFLYVTLHCWPCIIFDLVDFFVELDGESPRLKLDKEDSHTDRTWKQTLGDADAVDVTKLIPGNMSLQQWYDLEI